MLDETNKMVQEGNYASKISKIGRENLTHEKLVKAEKQEHHLLRLAKKKR